MDVVPFEDAVDQLVSYCHPTVLRRPVESEWLVRRSLLTLCKQRDKESLDQNRSRRKIIEDEHRRREEKRFHLQAEVFEFAATGEAEMELENLEVKLRERLAAQASAMEHMTRSEHVLQERYESEIEQLKKAEEANRSSEQASQARMKEWNQQQDELRMMERRGRVAAESLNEVLQEEKKHCVERLLGLESSHERRMALLMQEKQQAVEACELRVQAEADQVRTTQCERQEELQRQLERYKREIDALQRKVDDLLGHNERTADIRSRFAEETKRMQDEHERTATAARLAERRALQDELDKERLKMQTQHQDEVCELKQREAKVLEELDVAIQDRHRYIAEERSRAEAERNALLLQTFDAEAAEQRRHGQELAEVRASMSEVSTSAKEAELKMAKLTRAEESVQKQAETFRRSLQQTEAALTSSQSLQQGLEKELDVGSAAVETLMEARRADQDRLEKFTAQEETLVAELNHTEAVLADSTNKFQESVESHQKLGTELADSRQQHAISLEECKSQLQAELSAQQRQLHSEEDIMRAAAEKQRQSIESELAHQLKLYDRRLQQNEEDWQCRFAQSKGLLEEQAHQIAQAQLSEMERLSEDDLEKKLAKQQEYNAIVLERRERELRDLFAKQVDCRLEQERRKIEKERHDALQNSGKQAQERLLSCMEALKSEFQSQEQSTANAQAEAASIRQHFANEARVTSILRDTAAAERARLLNEERAVSQLREQLSVEEVAARQYFLQLGVLRRPGQLELEDLQNSSANGSALRHSSTQVAGSSTPSSVHSEASARERAESPTKKRRIGISSPRDGRPAPGVRLQSRKRLGKVDCGLQIAGVDSHDSSRTGSIGRGSHSDGSRSASLTPLMSSVAESAGQSVALCGLGLGQVFVSGAEVLGKSCTQVESDNTSETSAGGASTRGSDSASAEVSGKKDVILG